MKIFKILSIGILLGTLGVSCSKDFLEYEPEGLLSSSNVATADNAEALVTAAYAGIANDDMIGPITGMWAYGSVRSDDSYKGGGGVGDVDVVDHMEQFYQVKADMSWWLPNTWTNHYKAISRTNFALKVINDIEDAEYSNKTLRTAELRFLRAHSHFMLKILFDKVPYITEDLTQEEIMQTGNDLSNDELWGKIIADFKYAYDNLPQSQDQVGRADKNAAAAYLAKAKLYQAYKQDDNHQVTSIDSSLLQEVITYADAVTGSLQPEYGENFLNGYDNGPESIWAAQFSVNDGTTVGRLSFVNGLNSPHGSTLYGCCGFHLASQNMVNAFQTDEDGLPLLDSFNDNDILTDLNTSTNYVDVNAGLTVDPRLDSSIGVPGRPFKYRNTVKEAGDMIYSYSWARDPGVYGYFGNMKEQQAPDCSCYVKEGPFMGTSKNIDFIRYADVLLFKAEALIQLDRYNEALPIINQVRARAAASTQLATAAGATDIYNVQPYASFPSKEYAWKALKFERRLEFAMEDWRFFDLVRWGEASTTLNAYFAKEKTRRSFLSNAKFTAGRDEYFPIPQNEIDFTGGLYKQNPGY